MNCWVKPFATDGFTGVTAIDCSIADVTVSSVDPLTEFRLAPMVLVPAVFAVTRPPVAMVAVEVFEDDHVTEAVRFSVLLSVYVPVALNCWVAPLIMVGFPGVMAMDCRAGGVTVSNVDPAIELRLALMVLVPVLFAVANPLAAMVATAVFVDAQVTIDVRFWVLLSL